MTKLDAAHKTFVKHLEKQGRSSATLIAYGKDIEQLVNYLLNIGVNHTHEVELTHLESYMKKLSGENLTPKSISRKTNSTKTFFKYLHEEGHVSVNVSDLLKHPKLDAKAPRILSKLEYRALRDAAREDVRAFAIIEVLLQTGVTISELADIKTSDLQLSKESNQLVVPNKNAKETRTIPLNKAVVESINKYIEQDRPKDVQSDYLFITKTGKPLLVRNIRSTIDRYFKSAGVESAKVNDLRHTFVAFHLSQGVNLQHLSKIAGHKRISTTERYLEYIDFVEDSNKSELGIL
jgi:site-specific recombinase XerD